MEDNKEELNENSELFSSDMSLDDISADDITSEENNETIDNINNLDDFGDISDIAVDQQDVSTELSIDSEPQASQLFDETSEFAQDSFNEFQMSDDANLPQESIENDFSLQDEQISYSNDHNSSSNELIDVRPVKFQQFQPKAPNRSIKKNLDIMQDVSMHISVELGRTKSSIKEVMELEEGSIVELDKIAGEQVEIFVNDKFVAKGEVIVIEDRFGVRVTATNIQKAE